MNPCENTHHWILQIVIYVALAYWDCELSYFRRKTNDSVLEELQSILEQLMILLLAWLKDLDVFLHRIILNTHKQQRLIDGELKHLNLVETSWLRFLLPVFTIVAFQNLKESKIPTKTIVRNVERELIFQSKKNKKNISFKILFFCITFILFQISRSFSYALSFSGWLAS